MPWAVEHIRRMRGGAQPHLMRCADEAYYVVKFLNNPQHQRVLANEWVATKLASLIGLPVADAEIVEVPAPLVEQSGDLVIQLVRSRTKCVAGRQFGSRYPGDPAETVVYDFLPEEQLIEVANLRDFLGMLVFDKWTCNTNGRQVIFYRPAGQSRFQALMIDQGFCFNAGEWAFPDAPLRGLYARARVYESVTGIASFDPWLERLDSRITQRALDDVAEHTPPEWYNFDHDALYQLLERLWQRRRRVRDLVTAAKDTYRQPFPNWK
ncbi:MAG TPA: HipA family kinase [Candidatus Acidoferrales bacterium]|nr:HipA family kinase [Candidatus Acidoferrales bacterium]